ncbi:LysR family transcriptional regulator [Variovorax sp. KBS0712]|uniref:LysR family transcriptional regulator n=1 Tax=Variovorax sp. KBS0712 TaxID=2578111 RepID=UPI00111A03E5|nr:LysR family transcriptional regulator [Variovorax sp. KBS0712]TSD57053.1 LysR family transcriptional regulator [Variovorax sp. KBS0712]
MNLRQIEVFRAIMTTGTASDAARLLHVSVPAISRVLSHTESQLRFPLFTRVKGRLVPTDEARRLYREVADVYLGVQRIRDLTQDLVAQRTGLVSVVSSPGVGHVLVPMSIAQLHQANPEIHVRFRTMTQALLIERLLGRQADLGISLDAVDHPSLVSVPIARCRIVCICPRDHPLASRTAVGVNDLLPFDFIGYPRGTPLGERVRNLFAGLEELPRMPVEVGSPQNACALVQLGVGVALVDEFTMLAWSESRLRTLPVEEVEPVVAHLVYLRTDPLSPATEAFVRCFRSVLLQRGMAVPRSEQLSSELEMLDQGALPPTSGA